MAVVFNADSYVWVADDEDMYVPAQVVGAFEQGKAGQVKVLEKNGKGSKPRKLTAEESKTCSRMDEQSLKPISDMVGLKNLDEASILHNLRLRYDKDVIYTNVGRILVSLNPFKMLPIYSPGVMDQYMESGSRDLDPHVYGVADDAFRAMVATGKDQSCIVSGESGAGKTEATKLFLQYIAEKSKREGAQGGAAKGGKKGGAGGGDDSSSIQNKVLEANPLMEAFGNAKTVRNNNSSRFGKWIQIQMSKNGEIVGGSITNYLLEKSRLVLQSEGERNYHIFYQLCAGAMSDPRLKERLELMDATQYFYLNQSKKPATQIPNVDDADEWKSTLMAFDVVRVDPKTLDAVLLLLAGVLHLGNVRFGKGSGEGTSVVANEEVLALAAEQLGTKKEVLAKALTQRQLVTGKETTWGNNSPDQAAEARDALAKQAYSMLFDWLIEQINASLGLAKSGVAKNNIGVLDIFGFESFEQNSFEQLCINYCNEKLQGHFNDHIFTLEQAEYAKEGVDVAKIKFEDNAAVIELIEAGKGAGILSKIEEEIKTGRGTDATLLQKVLAGAAATNGVLAAPDVKLLKKKPALKDAFVFRHYAGPVDYDTRGFIEKCRDTLPVALMAVGLGSSHELLKKLFKQAEAEAGKKKTLGTQFKDQLAQLMGALTATQPHFVRCIKPNAEKVGNLFQAPMVLSQLRYAGLLEVCRIRKQGYPIRRTFKEFVQAYSPLAQPGAPKEAPALCAKLEAAKVLVAGQYQVGKNKVFLRDEQFDKIEVALEKALSKIIRKMQGCARGFIVRNRAAKWKKAKGEVERAMKSRNMANLEEALLFAGVLPYGGRHLPYIADARKLLDVLREEARVTEMLEAALESKDLAEIKRALKSAEEKNMGGSALAKEALKVMEKIESEKKVRDELRAAVDVGTDVAKLEAALAKAKSAGILQCVEARDATALVARLKEQQKVVSDLDAAIKAKNVKNIVTLMNRMAELGQKEHPLVIEGQKVAQEQAKASKAREEQQERLLDELDAAIKARDLDTITNLEVEVLQIGLEEHEVVKRAMALRKQLQGLSEVTGALASEMRAATAKAGSPDGIAAKDIDSLNATIAAAKKSGVAADDAKLKEAGELLARLEKQAQVQSKLDGMVRDVESKKSNKKEMLPALVAALASAQASGVETVAARKIREWVTTLEQEDAEARSEELAKKRQQNLEKLREGKKEELEQHAMDRLAKLTSATHKALVDKAKDDSVYELRKYYKLRTDEDFTEMLPEEEKAAAARGRLESRQKPLPKSLLKLADEQSRMALRINRAVLQYCGDMNTSFPATLAQYILVKGLEDPSICDEVYAQLCKHVTVNPKPDSADRAWLLLCMATRTFPPSDNFAPYLVNFLLKNSSLPGLPGNYARLCVVQLDATLEMGPSPYKPNLEDIQQYRKRPPILAPVHMITGEVVQYPITPDLRVAQVVEIIRRQEKLTDKKEMPIWGIFVKDGKENGKLPAKQRLEAFYRHYNPQKLKHAGLFLEHWKGKEEELFAKLVEKYGPEPEPDNAAKKNDKTFMNMPVTGAMTAVKMLALGGARKPPPAPQTCWPLPWWAHLGDVYLRMTAQNKEPVFEFRRRMITPETTADKRLYCQLLKDVASGDLWLDDEADVVEAALIAVAMETKGFKPPKGDALAQAGLVKNMAPYHRRRKTPQEWAKIASGSSDDKLPRTEPKLIERFVQICKKSPVYGMTFFYARRSDENGEYVIGIDHDGIHFITKDDAKVKVVETIPYSVIIKYGATVEYFWVNMDDKSGKKKASPFAMGGGSQGVNLLLYTLQSWELYEMVFDYTHLDTDVTKAPRDLDAGGDDDEHEE
jgi:myosin heavy subunit